MAPTIVFATIMNELNNKRILVLGASGQLGSELLSQLSHAKCQITAIRNASWEVEPSENAIYRSLDLNSINDEELKNLIDKHDYIFHLAGDTSVSALVGYELAYQLNWLVPLQKILNFMINTKKVLVFSSSVSVYGSNPSLPITEDTLESPETSYDLAKLACDNLVRYYRKTHKVACVSLRFSNIYGSNISVGKASRRAINKMLDIIHKDKAIKIIGDGRYYRNYIHVFDSAAMLINAGINILDTPPVSIACSTENMMFKDVINLLTDLYEIGHKEKVNMSFGLESRFSTDTRNFFAQPSDCYRGRFQFKYNLRKGFEELIKIDC